MIVHGGYDHPGTAESLHGVYQGKGYKTRDDYEEVYFLLCSTFPMFDYKQYKQINLTEFLRFQKKY